MRTNKIFYITATRLVRLERIRIESEDEEMAVDEYLRLAKGGKIKVAEYNMWALDKGDLIIEESGESPDIPF